MIIRQARIEDIPAITDIQIGGWLAAYRGMISDEDLEKMKASRAERIARHTNSIKAMTYIVAEKDGEIVGFSRYVFDNSFSPDFSVDCELLALYVKPDCKRQGIGKALMNYVKDEFRKQGKKRMILWCLRDNFPSRAFYEAMGGKLADRGKEFDLNGHKYPEAGFIYEL
ncbi:GNAT family N-acetyltransferase [Candidatus Saccharibacteria bacterium]|nr:GNAT family N-acetyltransferase [Candidatus Saccharibacteria bacterium]